MRKLGFAAAIVLAALGIGYYAVAVAQPRASSDYLTPDLRTRVNALKRDAAPTTRENVVARAKLLWEWVNAYALTGGPVPVNATQALAPAWPLGEEEALGPEAVTTLIRSVESLLYEFRLKDEHPRGLPTAKFAAAGPFEIDSFQTLEQTITLGSLGMQVDGIFLLGRQQSSNGGLMQADDPAAPNYVSIKCSNPAASFEKMRIPFAGMHGGFRGTLPVPAFRLRGTALKPGDTVTITYGDKAGGSPGIRMQSYAVNHLLYPVYVDLEAKGQYLTLAWPSFAVGGKAAEMARVIAPSIVKPGEAFEIAVRTEDRLWNRASSGIPAYEIRAGGRTVASIPASREAVTVVGNLKLDTEGVHRFEAVSADGKIRAVSNPVWVEADPQRRIYWGETHAHTGMAEGQGTIEDFYRYGREDARLDFLGLSEHDIWLDDQEWKNMRSAVERYTEPGRFIAFLGYEWTSNRPNGGHHNVFFRTPQGRPAPVQQNYVLSRLYQGLRAANKPSDVLVIPHAHQAGDWRRSDPDLERLVEIMSMHGTFEWFGNYYLRNGYEVGFLAASDDHRTRPGLSGTMAQGPLVQMGGLVGVMAPEKTAPGIFDALRARATYAVTGAERILLDATLNGSRMGLRGRNAPERRIAAKVSGTAAIDRIDLVKNGSIIYSRRYAAAPLAPKSRVQVSFDSSSDPLGRDNPRGYRRWRGKLEVVNAKLATLEVTNFDNRITEFARQDGNTVTFYTETRGRADLLTLNLEDVTPSTSIRIELQAAEEYAVAPPQNEPSRNLPAWSLELPFGEMKEGVVARERKDGHRVDTVGAQLIDAAAKPDQAFEYVDRSEAVAGDYYYVRVTQLNGARAWSSPMWAGGERPR